MVGSDICKNVKSTWYQLRWHLVHKIGIFPNLILFEACKVLGRHVRLFHWYWRPGHTFCTADDGFYYDSHKVDVKWSIWCISCPCTLSNRRWLCTESSDACADLNHGDPWNKSHTCLDHFHLRLRHPSPSPTHTLCSRVTFPHSARRR